MGSKGEAPTWADQWASGEDSGSRSTNGKADKKTVAGNVKEAASEGFVKAKAAALIGAHKVKAGTSTGIKWVKEQYQKKRTSNFTNGSKGEALTWAYQWASGEDSGSRSTNGKADKKTVAGNVKEAASEGFVKAKAAALVGAHKVKAGTSTGIKWVKEQYQKKRTSK